MLAVYRAGRGCQRLRGGQPIAPNVLALSLLLAQLAFLLSAPLVGWLLGLLRAAEAGAAPTGRCPGCFLDYQHRLNRSRLFRSHATR